MKNIEILSYESASPKAQEIFDSLKQKIGKVPNIYAAMANSPVALKALLSLGVALNEGAFSAKEIEAIDLAAAEENQCDYCLCAHSALAKMQGFNDDEIKALRNASIEDNKLKALTSLTKEIVSTRGRPGQGLIDDFINAGYDVSALVDLIAIIAKSTLTNYFNHIADTEIDFPRV